MRVILSSAGYSSDGNFLTSSTNSLGSTTNYGYDTVTKLLAYIEDANSNRTAYSYDDRDRVTTVYLDVDGDGVTDTTESSVAYLYSSGRLSGINTATTAYTVAYDTFGNMVSFPLAATFSQPTPIPQATENCKNSPTATEITKNILTILLTDW